ncbi:hypothetical protein [Ralstonia pseudosolanacearum]
MENTKDVIEVWLHVPNWWIGMADINPECESEEIEYHACDVPIMAILSKQGLATFQESGKSTPDTSIILAKMKFEDMIKYANHFYSDCRENLGLGKNWEPCIAFDIENGNFKKPSNPSPSPKVKLR